MKLFSIPMLALVLLTSSCEKFLGVRPDTNQINLNQTKDLGEMLNTSGMAEPNFVIADLVSDDIMIPEQQLTVVNPNSYYTRAYLWAPTVWDLADTDPMYGNAYKWILQMNVILHHINQSEGGTPAQKSVISAQAKINRAYYYFQLLNMYGPAYQSSSASRDLAVPLVLAPEAAAKPARATVQQVYQQIVRDLTDAIDSDSLPGVGKDVIHPGKAAAHAMLARTYLYAGQYVQAQEQADSALAKRSGLLDYNSFIFYSNANPQVGIYNKPMLLIEQTNNPEILFAKICVDYQYFGAFKNTPFISDDLNTVLGNKDLRFVYNFYRINGNARYSYLPYNNNGMQFNYSIGVPEMMLIKAEGLARAIKAVMRSRY
ncbi:RagB/SusD family nutrient uptake outer membrane protein [Chitinophaga horti]|uniref:RagB/SusD family nutrient uptake outer membrane protein n=1 Tax=Chitinophaga horti TaxID=2920382 RepID=A0ABY6J6A7_9BACT|nr:RagB/SusD family nutrient uptake outer membrane protein [Chitinophaga horti]UYQ93821.1 RagB/SusD family nutrient uptake outer membrane protein [Chitinophaga horti]